MRGGEGDYLWHTSSELLHFGLQIFDDNGGSFLKLKGFFLFYLLHFLDALRILGQLLAAKILQAHSITVRPRLFQPLTNTCKWQRSVGLYILFWSFPYYFWIKLYVDVYNLHRLHIYGLSRTAVKNGKTYQIKLSEMIPKITCTYSKWNGLSAQTISMAN